MQLDLALCRCIYNWLTVSYGFIRGEEGSSYDLMINMYHKCPYSQSGLVGKVPCLSAWGSGAIWKIGGEGDGVDGKIKRRLVMSWDVWGKEGVSVKVKTSAKKRK